MRHSVGRTFAVVLAVLAVVVVEVKPREAVAGGTMYWTDSDAKQIQRISLNGVGLDAIVTKGLKAPVSITLDVAGGKVYWTEAHIGFQGLI